MVGTDEPAECEVNGGLPWRFVPDGSTDNENNPTMDARLATVTSAGAVYWQPVDYRGSVIATSDSAGQTAGAASYSP